MVKHYWRLWRENPGAMTVLHVFIVGAGITFAFMIRNPLASLGALAATCLVTLAILPACVAWDIERMKR